MNTKRTIALLIDEKQHLEGMIRYTAPLARDLAADLLILLPLPPYTGDAQGVVGHPVMVDPSYLEKTEDEIEAMANAIVQKLDKDLREVVTIEFRSLQSAPVDSLSQLVNEGSVHMVMLQGQAGRNFWVQKPLVMSIVRNVMCPVWIVEPDTQYQCMTKIVYATDLNREDVSALQHLDKLTQKCKPEIYAIHMTSEPDFDKRIEVEGFQQKVEEQVGRDKIEVSLLADQGYSYITVLLAREAERMGANVIALQKENLNFFERIFHISFTSSLIETTRLPVLVFHAK